MTATENELEKIRELYSMLHRKGEFKSKLAKKLGMSVKYLTNYWFPNCDGITEIHIKTVVKELAETIKEQGITNKSLSNN